ncbi:LysM peptidoglycan-binding domain-containing protein [Pengzhenrongella sicca]|uniref:LysM peptidoglycan-binding domain-containing protein n=1 Tax=Pengzhenrongella sicca TaxID=2819238 RepID=A0A8A4ZCI0_9MICO|nr:LysM peptidoglycan-binding domain-containing protein [Pengzhenrongella sicca]QTE28583.1 LysM peptidoglycan-binding domain-containing protein [Pengzhenrongella sicca]
MTTLTRRLLGLLTTVGLVGFAAGIPFGLTSFGLSPVDILTHRIWSNLFEPDDATMAWVGTAILVWAIWAVLVACLVVELVAALRKIDPPDLRGLTVPQSATRTLLTWASLLFIAVPAVTASIPAGPASASAGADVPAIATTAPLRPDQARASTGAPGAEAPRPAGPVASRPAPAARVSAPAPGTTVYEVKRGDSLWKIAETMLGDPMRYLEIEALNAELLGGQPGFIAPPMLLTLPGDARPAEATPAAGATYAVQAGDTLSQIAHDELGDASRYPEIFEASTTIIQPGGEKLTDPDLIKPGWTLDIATPKNGAAPPAATGTGEPANPPSADLPTPQTPATEPDAGPPPAATPSTTQGTGDSPPPAPPTTDVDVDVPESGELVQADDAQVETAPGWLLPGLSGAGALLAGALLLTVRAHRRTQLRYRKPGQILQPPPPGLLAVDRTAEASGTPTAPQIQTLDALLRELATTYPNPQQYPPIVTVELTATHARIHLTADAILPEPWNGDARDWSAPLTERAPATGIPPYPLLVTVGQSAEGHLWLLNLEQVGLLAITGDTERAKAFGRYLAAELALNPWSVLVSVHAIGFGDELALIDPLRYTHYRVDDPDALDEITRAVDPAGGVVGYDPETFHVLLAATTEHATTAAGVRAIAKAIATHPARPGAAVVMVGVANHDFSVEAATTAEGRLLIRSLGLDLDSVGLTAAEARDCALLAATTEEAPCVPYPIDHTASSGMAAVIDAAGALRPQLVNDRPADPTTPAGETSLLPLPTQTYVDVTPTTAQDIQTLAPTISDATASRVLAVYPDLDADVAEWVKGSDCAKPRLALLGPVQAHGRGDPHAAAKRRPFLTGLLGYLALHPAGVTSDQIKTIAGAENYRNNIKVLRRWMGKNPRTGDDYIPYASNTRAAKACGEPRYQVDDVLVDWDLFKALRARGTARGAGNAGITDLELALGLVTGVPFSQRHPGTWKWLDETERLDLIAPCAIVDVAHTVVIHALAIGDIPMARRAVDTAILAAPDDEAALLDLVEILRAEGHPTLARTKLHERIINRTEDHHAPIDLPARTADVLEKPKHMGINGTAPGNGATANNQREGRATRTPTTP